MVRYHLQEWGTGPTTPQNYKEFFNINHSKARNVIERTIDIFKKWWAILRCPSFYPINIQNKIILACALIHNFIRNESPNDPLDLNLQLVSETQGEDDGFIDSVNPSHAWTTWRDNLAQEMFSNWSGAA
ncbi:hypothetical protein ACS0TY_026215 [Phlomoides rotata]